MRKPTLAIAAAAAVSLSLASCSAEAQIEPTAGVSSISNGADTTNPPTADEQLASLYEPEVVAASSDDATDWDGATITTGGTYRITGGVGDVTVDAPDETVVLVLDNATVSGRINIDANAAALVLEGESTVAATGLGTDEGAVHATSDLTVTGSGKLTVESDGDGVVSKDDLVFTGGTVTVDAGDDAVRGTDSVSVRDGAVLDLTAAGDAKVEETNRVLRRVRASMLKDIGSEELAVTFETLQRIEQRASRPQDAKTAQVKTAQAKSTAEAR